MRYLPPAKSIHYQDVFAITPYPDKFFENNAIRLKHNEAFAIFCELTRLIKP
jgi:hypothetical protein